MDFYAEDGSVRVTIVDGGVPVSVSDNSYGVYANDGSYRVTVVAGGIPEDALVLEPDDEVPVVNSAASVSATGTYQRLGGSIDVIQLPVTYALVQDGQSGIQVTYPGTYDTGTATAVADVVSGAVSEVALPEGRAIIRHGGPFLTAWNNPQTVGRAAYPNFAGPEPFLLLDSTVYPVIDQEAIVVGGSTYTFTIAGGQITDIVVT